MRLFLIFLLTLMALNADELKKVNLQLAWKYQFQFAGYIIAKELGFYEQVGLDVQIKEYDDHAIDVHQEVHKGSADFGIGRSSLLLDWMNDENSAKVLLATLQSSPVVLIAKDSGKIMQLSDFRNKKLMALGDLAKDGNMLPILAMLASENLDLKDFQFVPPSFNPLDLANGNTDLMAVYLSNEPHILQEAGVNTQIFDPKEYGFDFYSDLLFTSQKVIDENPKMVQKFKEASIKGWLYAFENMDESVDIIFEKYNSQDKSKNSLLYEAKILKSLALKDDLEFGHISAVTLKSMVNVLQLLGFTKQTSVNVESLIYKEFEHETILLTQEQKRYIQENPVVKLGVQVDWKPFSYIDSSGGFNGLSQDYIDIISQKTGLQFDVNFASLTKLYGQFIENELDMLVNMHYSKEKDKLLYFSDSYLQVQESIFTRSGSDAQNMKDLFGKKVALLKDHESSKELQKKYAENIDFVSYEFVENAINALLTFKVDYLFGMSAVIQEALQDRAITNIVQTFEPLSKQKYLRFGVHKDDEVLIDIVSKALDDIPSEVRAKINDKWIHTNNKDDFDLVGLWKYMIPIFLILLGILYKNYILAKVNKRLQEKELLLSKQVDQNKQLLEDNKRFIADTVHQIRTPLSVIMANSSMIEMHVQDKNISEYVSLINGSINLLSSTYEDLAYLVSRGEVKYQAVNVNLSSKLQKRVEYFNTVLHVETRKIVCKVDDNIYFYINELEFERLVDNNITNAMKYGYEGRDIYISLLKQDAGIMLSFESKSPQIRKKELVFTKNYRENDSNRGLGLGLSIVKEICEKYKIEHKLISRQDLNVFIYNFPA